MRRVRKGTVSSNLTPTVFKILDIIYNTQMNIYLYVIIMITAFGGLSIANLIHRKKKYGHLLVCPIGTDCDPVIYSRYSQLFRIPLETVGAIYYTIIVLTYAAFQVSPGLHTPGAALVLLELTIVALLFSIYLTCVQAFALKQWCTWCLFSAAICLIIFLVEFKFAGFSDIVKIAEQLLAI